MRIGIFCIQPDANADPAIVAKHAEDLGFTSYWVPDHIVLPVTTTTSYPGNPGGGPDPDYLWQMPDPMIALMRAATATKTIEVGTGVLLVPERHPLHLAKEIASLDHYSGGRFKFGIGAGWNKEESEMLGGDFEHRWTQVREAIEAMKVCWTEHESEHHGKYYDFPPVLCYPKPTQKPHPPIFLGGIMFDGQWAKRVFHRIVKWGDGWCPVVASVDQIIDGREQIRIIAEEAGRDASSIEIRVFGGQNQWRTRAGRDALAEADVTDYSVWIDAPDTDNICRELDALAKELL
ncbi:MAG: putative F420-dependent oxidoreductase [Gammaproteobacteria bacterium]|jgi:probable F420-dependent oxidoreductase